MGRLSKIHIQNIEHIQKIVIQSGAINKNLMIFLLTFRQTGSGKTYTMEGMDDDDVKRGIISRTSSKIFQETSGLIEKVL